MKYTIIAGVVSLSLLVGAAYAQEGYRNDVAVSALGAFQQSTNGNGINQTSTNSGGVLATYRFFFTNHQGVELNYGYNRYSQLFTPSLLNSSAPFSGTLGVPANTNEATASYIYRFGAVKRFQPFVSAGTGALLFTPVNSFSVGGVSSSTFATPDFVYGAGADIPLTKRVTFRFGYRGHVFQAPDFGIQGIKTDSIAHMAEPFGGFSFHF
jgi:outer membrane immunogenic protein